MTITFSVTETPDGKLTIGCQVPDGSDGTLALLLADIAMKAMREGMKKATGKMPPMTESRLQ